MAAWTRRQWLRTALGAGAAAALARPTPLHSEGAPDDLVVHGPRGPASIGLARLATAEAPSQEGPHFGFQPWRNHDELEAVLTRGDARAAIMPTPLAAALYNRGVPLRLHCVLSWGQMYIASTDPQVDQLDDLKGRTVIVPGRGDEAELVLRYIAQKRGIGRTLRLLNLAGADEAMQHLLGRRGALVLADEPLASMALLRGIEQGIAVKRPIDLQQEWSKATGRDPLLPQLGLVVTEPLLRKHPTLAQALGHNLAQATKWAVNNPQPASRLAADPLGLPAAAIELSLKWANLDPVPAAGAREAVEFLLSCLVKVEPKLVGGKAPDEKFYLPA